MKRQHFCLLILLPILTTLISTIPLEATATRPLIVEDPTPGFVAIVLQGSQFNITFKQEVDVNAVSKVYLSTVILDGGRLVKYVYELEIVGREGNILTVKVPNDAIPTLYDLVVIINDTEYTIERSVWVLKEYPRYLLISHSTDHHAFIAPRNKRITIGILSQLLEAQLALITGDITDTAGSDEYVEMLDTLDWFYYGIPALLIPGNHDWGTENYQKYVGPRVWYRRIGDFLIVGIDTKEPGVAPLITDEEFQWLNDTIRANADAKVKIVLMHHPLFYWHGTIEASYDTLDSSMLSFYWGAPGGDYPQYEKYARAFLKLCEDYNITLVLAGHIHRDQYVIYKSTRTNTTTWFITSTTAAQSRPNYNGFQIINVTVSGVITFPYAPPSFSLTGYRGTVYNSISVDPEWDWYFYTVYGEGTYGKGLGISNELGYMNVSGLFILRLPWTYEGQVITYTSTTDLAFINVTDYLIVSGYLYLALNVSIPTGSKVSIAVSSEEDTKPPEVKEVLRLPSEPRPGSPLTVYLAITDEVGIFETEFAVTVDGESWGYTISKSGDYYIVTINPVPEGKTAILTVYAKDFTGKEVVKSLFYQFGITPTPTTPPPTETITVTVTETVRKETTVTTAYTVTEKTTSTVYERVVTTETTHITKTQTETLTRTSTVTRTLKTSLTSMITETVTIIRDVEALMAAIIVGIVLAIVLYMYGYSKRR